MPVSLSAPAVKRRVSRLEDQGRHPRLHARSPPGLAQLDRNINDVFLRVIASAESDSHRAALALTRQQRDFVGKRNASFGRRGYDLRQAMEDRLEKLNPSPGSRLFAPDGEAFPA